jgi:heme exporter protein A
VEPVVALQGVGVSLGDMPVLRDIDLTLMPTRILGVVGPNGSGKTTLLRLAATLLRPDRGRATVLGVDTASPDIYRVRPTIGMIGHVPSLVPELTLSENLDHVARLAGIGRDRVGPALSAVGLASASDRRADASSHGMQRRVEIAHLLMRRPRLLLLDEAISGLDTDAAGLVTALVDRTTAAGGGVIMVSHDRAQLTSCHEMLALSSGRMSAE